jgi:uncharacterized protein (DUF983 family)
MNADRPGLMNALFRGIRRRCPNCGNGRVLHSYLKVISSCDTCSEPLGHIRADDFPPYITIVIVGHIMLPLVLFSERQYALPTWMHMSLWPPLALILMFMVLPIAKGACVGLMWHLGLRGDEHQ